jgi:uncharacterized protein (DUF983 family)
VQRTNQGLRSVRPTLARMLGRGVRRRCPVCGGGKLFTRWMRMKERCPTCGFKYEREEGFFLGAMVINIAVTEAAMFVGVVLLVVLTLPHPPLALIILVGVLSSVVVPVVGYPFSKTLWSAIDLAMHPLDPDEEATLVLHQGAGAGAGEVSPR